MFGKIGRNDPCWCGCGKKYKACHMAYDEKLKDFKRQGYVVPRRKLIKKPEDIEGIKRSAVINMACLDAVGEAIRPGMCTQEIDDIVSKVTRDMGGIPAPLDYEGFPKSVCTSINDVVCHGIPSEDEILEEGDIVNVDCSTILDGYFSDSSRMFLIGEVQDDWKQLVADVKESVQIGLDHVKPWMPMGHMSHAIDEFCQSKGYEVVREIGGHGIGLEFHEDPFVSYVLHEDEGMIMAPGLCFTIEPMVNMGRHDVLVDEDDEWTVFTEDGSPSAQWEVQLVVTDTGYEVLCS